MFEIYSLVYSFGYQVENNGEKFLKLSVSNFDNVIKKGLVICIINNNKIKDGFFVENNLRNIIFNKNYILINGLYFKYSDVSIKILEDEVYLDIEDFRIIIKNKSVNLINDYPVKLDELISTDDLEFFKNKLYTKYNNFFYEMNLMDNKIIFDKKFNRHFIYDSNFSNKVDVNNCSLVIKYNIDNDKDLESTLYLQHSKSNMTSVLAYCKLNN